LRSIGLKGTFLFSRSSFCILTWLLLSVNLFAQPSTNRSFDFLNIPNHARLAALGGLNVSLADRDVNFFSSNPALSSDSLDNFGSASYQAYVAKIGHASASYQHPFSKIGSITFGVQHIGYGSIQGYDLNGIETGEFNSSETALYVSKSHEIGNFRMGVTLKGAFSNLAGFRANAVVADIGGLFVHPKQALTVGLVIKNLGVVLSDYSSSTTTLPFDVQVGGTFKPEHMPLRFSITGYNLTRNVSYFNASTDAEKPGIVKRIFHHVNFGSEILIHRNVNILIGYNYLVHETLKLETGGGGAGLSFGFSAAIKAFEFTASRNGYVAGTGGYSFTLTSDINRILKRR
jgi:hypothetical protein